MLSGGNILALQKILGHHDIKMTMRYAHLAPDHLETALRYNLLATMGQSSLNAAHVHA
jgi:site-specific recombinase XerD